MKTFVTKEYLKLCADKVAELQKALEEIRRDKNVAFEGDTNTWHDNFAYENATREEKLAEDRLFKALRDMDGYTVFSGSAPAHPPEVGLVPFGAQDIKNKIFSYNAPIVFPLMGAKVGDERIVKIPLGTFKTKILDIQKMR